MNAIDIGKAELERIVCPTCQIILALPREYIAGRVEDGKIFYCPEQHKMTYSKERAQDPPREDGSEDELAVDDEGVSDTEDSSAELSFDNIREWGRANGWEVGVRGRLPAGLLDAFQAAREKASA